MLFEELKNNILKVGALSTALKKYGHFSAYEYFSIQIEEETGKVTSVLKDLAKYYRKMIKQKRGLTKALKRQSTKRLIIRQSLTHHQGETFSGEVMGGTLSMHVVATPVVRIYQATMFLNPEVTFTITYKGCPKSTSHSYSSSKTFGVL